MWRGDGGTGPDAWIARPVVRPIEPSQAPLTRAVRLRRSPLSRRESGSTASTKPHEDDQSVEGPNKAQWTTSWAAHRPGGQSLGLRASGHLIRVTALAATALVAALCLPAGQAHP